MSEASRCGAKHCLAAGPDQLADDSWLAAAEHNIDEMVAMAANHPSVLIWGCCNEGASKDPACRPGFERLLRRLRALDASRPVTYAAMDPFQTPEVSADLADIVAVNTYPGWYWGRIEDIAGELDRIEAAVRAAGLDDRPLIVAEIGAEAIAGGTTGRQNAGARSTKLTSSSRRFLMPRARAARSLASPLGVR